MRMFQPVIKWSGSKRPIAQEIVNLFPKEIDTYYEPFCGGASVMRCLLDNVKENKIKVNNFICSDINNDLINLWNTIKTSPEAVFSHYNKLWYELNSTEEQAVKRAYFEQIRDRLNKEHNPLDFIFILRTCYNGLIRYNQKGEFNTSYHLNRNGIKPEKFKNIIFEWSDLLQKYNITFKCSSYEKIITKEDDLMFLDPPYANVDSSMYFGSFNNSDLFEFLTKANCKWLLTYDGKSGDVDKTYKVPDNIFKRHLYLKSGNSSFKRIVDKSNDSIVYESLYANY